MNQYLLLRDNKQSGPYTAPELETKGLKPYDLVWHEGKSAAWRYPSEIEDLKHFAPVVEEQPYDRFYKKIASEKQEPSIPSTPIATPKIDSATQPFVQQPAGKQKRDNGSKVYVTLPTGARGADPVPSRSIRRVEDTPKKKSDLSASGYNRYEVKNDVSSIIPTPVPENAFGNRLHTEDRGKYPLRKPGTQKVIIRSLAAASLLLAGILLGMFLMSKTQQGNMQRLDALVEQINERNQKQQSAVAQIPEERIPDSHQTASLIPAPDENLLLNSTASEDTISNMPVVTSAKKSIPITRKKDEQSTESVTVRENIVIPAVLPVAEPVTRNEIPKELALKNLFQLVQLKGNNYKTGLLGGISNLQLTIVNRSLYQLEKVDVELEYLGPENKVVKRQTLAFKDIPPGEELTIEVPKSGRGVSVNYAIRQINSDELGIAKRN